MDILVDDFEAYEWNDLHNGDYFVEVVVYLRGLLENEFKLSNE